MRRVLTAVVLFGSLVSAQTSGARVSGRVVPAPGPLAAELAAIRISIIPSGYPQKTIETAVKADGSFQFTDVPAGPYIVRLLTGNSSVSTDTVYPTHGIFVGDGDLSGVEIPGPIVVAGRVVVEGGGPLPVASVPLNSQNNAPRAQGLIDARSATLVGAAAKGATGARTAASVPTVDAAVIREDGAFVLGLLPGSYQLSMRSPAPGYAVRSLTFGTVDLTQQPLTVTASTSSQIVVILSSTPGFVVRGRVTGMPLGPVPAGVNVNAGGVVAPVNADGTFALRNLPPGARTVTLVRSGGSPFSGQTGQSRLSTINVNIVDRDVNGIELTWIPLAPVSAQVALSDKTGARIEGIVEGARVTVTSRDGKPLAGGCDYTGCRADILTFAPQAVGAQATNSPLLPVTEADVRVEQLPPGYIVRSISSGGIDLMKNPLRVDETTTAVDIEIEIQNMNGARLAGKVLTSGAAPVLPAGVTLRSMPTGRAGGPGSGGATVSAFQATVAADGSYEFLGIPPGTYTLSSRPDGSPLTAGSTTTNITLGDRDLANVPIIGVSDIFRPTTVQSANEAAAFQNLTRIQRAQTTFNQFVGRYGTIADLIAARLLHPAFTGTVSGYTFSVTPDASDFTGTALPLDQDGGRYDFFFVRGPGASTTRTAGMSNSQGRSVSRDPQGRITAVDGATVQQVASCGGDVPLCLRFQSAGPLGTQPQTVTGRIVVAADATRTAAALPADLYVGLVSGGNGNLAHARGDGSFSVALPSTAIEHRVEVHNLPEGYRVKTITASGAELANGMFKTGGGTLDITLEYKP